ncbi:hypothetical protein NE857_02265 [Nocardiopsis exhalans]|uniref:WXG100 family type VII secretion target n=1 Tax=Nocardiopsis exhalans TaxID=163604 RepID=A0ABY5D9A6_9ACTN|nr:hypothetical protein [Nocardiopsis exhalans]USY20505.1 hypothetical protein NE857_02265 [Nocardiopsis exhalans]
MSGQRIDVNFDSANDLIMTTEQAFQELGTQVEKLMTAAEPMKKSFSGSSEQEFTKLQERATAVADELNRGLFRMNEGQGEFAKVILAGDTEMADEARSQMSAANFDAAKFR